MQARRKVGAGAAVGGLASCGRLSSFEKTILVGNMTHRRMAVAILAAIGLAGAQAPAPDPSLKFEVASIKPSTGGGRGMRGIRPAPGGLGGSSRVYARMTQRELAACGATRA